MIIMLIEFLFQWTEKYKMKTLIQIYTKNAYSPDRCKTELKGVRLYPTGTCLV